MILMIFKFEAFLILRSGTLFYLNKVLIFQENGGKLKAPHKLQFNITFYGKTIGIDGFLYLTIFPLESKLLNLCGSK